MIEVTNPETQNMAAQLVNILRNLENLSSRDRYTAFQIALDTMKETATTEPIKAEVFTRHSADCEHKTQRYYRACNCRKWIHVFGKNQRFSAKTRSWQKAEELCHQIRNGVMPKENQ